MCYTIGEVAVISLVFNYYHCITVFFCTDDLFGSSVDDNASTGQQGLAQGTCIQHFIIHGSQCVATHTIGGSVHVILPPTPAAMREGCVQLA